MNRFPILALVSLSSGWALACGDDSDANSGQGGTQNSSNAGTAGSSSMAGGSGGSSSGSSGAGGDGIGGAGISSGSLVVQDVCRRGCAKTEPLNCLNDPADCEAQCLADYLDFPEECRELVLAFGNCAADRPASDLLCGGDGRATLRDGVCEAEAVALASCVLLGPL